MGETDQPRDLDHDQNLRVAILEVVESVGTPLWGRVAAEDGLTRGP